MPSRRAAVDLLAVKELDNSTKAVAVAEERVEAARRAEVERASRIHGRRLALTPGTLRCAQGCGVAFTSFSTFSATLLYSGSSSTSYLRAKRPRPVVYRGGTRSERWISDVHVQQGSPTQLLPLASAQNAPLQTRLYTVGPTQLYTILSLEFEHF